MLRRPREGFYIDIGSGHPVYDNVSFAFYLKGWRGITVEPNPWLARLSRGVRPRDRHVEALVGSVSEPAATFYLVNEFHGLSTMFENHAQAALAQFGKSAQAITVPLTTLRALCEEGHAPASFDFLKVDVEGAEPAVLLGGDWERFRPKVIVVEALAPYTLAPAWAAMGAVSRPPRLRLCLVRQPQPLLPRRRGRRAQGLLHRRAGDLR